MKNKDEAIIIGYSGHAFVVCDVLYSQGIKILGYCENKKKSTNPYSLPYLGSEQSPKAHRAFKNVNYFIAIGDNNIRKKIYKSIRKQFKSPMINAIHKKSYISPTANIGIGVMVGVGTIINAYSSIGNGVICNTQSVIEHECSIGSFSHIAPGAVLCGNVKVGKNSFIGAGSIIKQGVSIGNNVIIGAGTVVIRNVKDNKKIVGNPQRIIS